MTCASKLAHCSVDDVRFLLIERLGARRERAEIERKTGQPVRAEVTPRWSG